MVRLVADVALNPAFPAGELDRLKGDMLREIAIQKSQPQPIALEKFRSVMYGDHPYGRLWPSEEALQSYTVEQIRAFHDEHFGGARSRLYVVGRFDAAAVEQAIREAFAPLERGTPADQPVPAPRTRRAVHLLDRPNAPQSTIILGLPVVDPSHPDWVALQVTNALLGGSFGSRITSNIREDKGYTYSPFSTISTRPDDAYWAQQADVTTDVTGASLREIFHEIDRLRNEPPPQEELAGIQNYLAGTFVLQNSARASIANQLAFVDLHGLPDDYLETYVQRVYAVTPQEVQRIAQTYLDPAQMQIVVVGDVSKVREQVAEYGEVIE
jgi:predicted Zn-dependent peptidase